MRFDCDIELPFHNRNLLLNQGILSIVSCFLFLFSGLEVGAWPIFIAFNFIGILSGLMSVGRVLGSERVITNRTACLIFLLNLTPFWFLLGQTSYTSGLFTLYNLAAFSAAMLAPSMTAYGVSAIVSFPLCSFLHSHELPMATIGLDAIAVALYFFRLRGLRVGTVTTDYLAKAEMTEKLADTLLAIKDLANSPIQALAVDAEILRRKYAVDPELVERIVGSTARLRDLNRIIEQKCVGVPVGLRVSLDAHRNLAETHSLKSGISSRSSIV